MKWFVCLLLGILLIGGFTRLVLFFMRRRDLLIASDKTLGTRSLIALGLLNIAFSGLGLFLLFSQTYTPVDILIGVTIVGAVFEVAFRKGSINWAG